METLKDRKENLFNFLDEVEDELSRKKKDEEFRNSSNYKMNVIKMNKDDCKNRVVCIILGDLYKKSLPFDASYIQNNDQILNSDIEEMFGDRKPYEYIQEALDKNNSFILKKILEAADNMCEKKFSEKEDNVAQISSDDLDYKINEEDIEDLREDMSELEFDDISEIIKNNVQNTVMDEISKAKEEEQRKQDLQASLEENNDIRTDEDIEENITQENTIYTPSLFEALMINKTKLYKENTNEADPAKKALEESIKVITEMTLLKTLKLEEYTPYKLTEMANDLVSETA